MEWQKRKSGNFSNQLKVGEKMKEAIFKFLDEQEFNKIIDETWCLLMQFERATPDQLKRLQELLKEAGYDC